MRYLFLFFSCWLLACSSQEGPEQIISQIETLENQIGANPDATDKQVNSLLGKYESFAAHADSEEQQVVDYLLRAGDVSTRLKDYNRTLGYYETILEKYPENPRASRAHFMKAFTLDNKLGKLEEAKKEYEAFLAKYPDDDFANDAAFSLKNLGKSAEEIIQGFEAKKAEEDVE